MRLSHKELTKKAAEHHEWMVEIRRHLHRNPEISFQEFDTTDYIIEKLDEIGIPSERPLKTGCVGVIEGKTGKASRTIALRADIDALEMQEEGEHKMEFMSKRPGAAHCCGHDAHTANLLGVARVLAEHAGQIDGKVILIFQPGEEKIPGGGRLLCETGFLQGEGVEEIYGLHTSPLHKPGTIAVKPGPMMARPDEFEIELIGKGGHAASPHDCVDPIVMASEVVGQFQTIASRSVNPAEPVVLTVGKIESGSAYNVIPDKAYMLGTVRTFNRDTALQVRERMESVLQGVTSGFGGRYKFQFNEGYPSVQNDEGLTSRVRKTAEKLYGKEQVLELEKPLMAGEDFAFYQEHFPGTFFLLGSGSEEAGSTWSWHHPKYNVDERCFLTGVPLMAALALNL